MIDGEIGQNAIAQSPVTVLAGLEEVAGKPEPAFSRRSHQEATWTGKTETASSTVKSWSSKHSMPINPKLLAPERRDQ